MKILALETATDACSVALWKQGEVSERYREAPREHADLILPMVDALLGEAGIKLNALDAIAFGCGPGAFTGVRVAACVAQGLALGAGLPVVPISTLAALAFGALKQAPQSQRCLVAVDARMSELYWGWYYWEDERLLLCADEVVGAPEKLTIPNASFAEGFLVAGTGWAEYQHRISDSVRNSALFFSPLSLPRASDVLGLAVPQFAQHGGVAAELALPNYLRNNVATPPKNVATPPKNVV